MNIFVSGNTLWYSISSHIFQKQTGLSQHSVKMQIYTTNFHIALSAQEAQKVFHTTECYGLTRHTLLQVAWTPGIQTRDRQICSASDAWWWSQSSCRERKTRLTRSLGSYISHGGWETRLFVYQLFLGWHPQNEMFFIWKKWLHRSYWKWRKKIREEKTFFLKKMCSTDTVNFKQVCTCNDFIKHGIENCFNMNEYYGNEIMMWKSCHC